VRFFGLGGQNIGRGSPEIDVIEAQVSGGQGTASQSVQVAPFDNAYTWDNVTSAGLNIANPQTFLKCVVQAS
jgi:beta-glucan synthesis-associated protein KRE6